MKSLDISRVEINWTWFLMLIILLFGAFTKTDLVDKLFWFLLGVDVSYADQYFNRNKKITND